MPERRRRKQRGKKSLIRALLRTLGRTKCHAPRTDDLNIDSENKSLRAHLRVRECGGVQEAKTETIRRPWIINVLNHRMYDVIHLSLSRSLYALAFIMRFWKRCAKFKIWTVKMVYLARLFVCSSFRFAFKSSFLTWAGRTCDLYIYKFFAHIFILCELKPYASLSLSFRCSFAFLPLFFHLFTYNFTWHER